jgi:hypothetical protein
MSVAAAVTCALCAAAPAQAELIYGMTAASSASTAPGVALVKFDSATPGAVTTVGAFTGIVAGHALRSIDFRPATGQLYAISTSTSNLAAAQLYTVNLNTGALTPVGGILTLTGNTSPRVEIDFNPVADRIRIVTGGTTANNFRAHPDTGALVAVDTALSWAPGDPNEPFAMSIIGGAYSNNFAGATSTTLYAWDYGSDSLLTIGGLGGAPSPNGGVMFSIDQPADFMTGNAALGMDISGASGILYVTHDDPDTAAFMSLFTRNLATGEETLIGAYPASNLFIVDISVSPVPEPAAMLMMALGIAGLLARQRIAQRR